MQNIKQGLLLRFKIENNCLHNENGGWINMTFWGINFVVGNYMD